MFDINMACCEFRTCKLDCYRRINHRHPFWVGEWINGKPNNDRCPGFIRVEMPSNMFGSIDLLQYVEANPPLQRVIGYFTKQVENNLMQV